MKKPSNSHDVNPLQWYEVMPSKEKIVKTIIYLSQELFNQLNEVWLKLRKSGLSKNDIIIIALNHIISNKNKYLEELNVNSY